jgi:hypothetical protein
MSTVLANLHGSCGLIQHGYYKHFKGHKTLTGHFVKILAYTDNTTVHLGSLTDIKIYKLLLRQYSFAMGGVANFHKSETVTCGPWKKYPQDLGIRVVKLPSTLE